MKFVLVFISAMILCPYAYGQEGESIEIEAIIEMRAEPDGLKFEQWVKHSEEVLERGWRIYSGGGKEWMDIPKQTVRITRLTQRRIRVELSKPHKFWVTENGERTEVEISEFEARWKPKELDLLMKIQKGSYFIHTNSNLDNVPKFVETMKSEGFTKEMAEWVETKWSPLTVYKAQHLTFGISIERFLNGQLLIPRNFTYVSEVMINNTYSTPSGKIWPISLKNVLQVVDFWEPWIQEFIEAKRKIQQRIDGLKLRGWWPNLYQDEVLRKQEPVPEESLPYKNIEPIRVRCELVFK